MVAGQDTGHPAARGAITDSNGVLVSSANPIVPGHEYVIYGTGMGYSSAVYIGLSVPAKQFGVTAIPDYIGKSPCCLGLDQINFHLPDDFLRAFSADGSSLPFCSTLPAEIDTEITLTYQDFAFSVQSNTSVSIPVRVNSVSMHCLN
jgi:hypothetical protein